MMHNIHHLAMHGKNTELEALLQNPDINVDERGLSTETTPLILASRRGHLLTVRLLLAKGANPTIVVSGGYTALHVVIDKLITVQQPAENFYAIAKELLQYQHGEGLKLLNLPVSIIDDRTLFESLRRYPEVKKGILQIIKEIDPNHPLLLSANTSSKQQAAITAPTREETPVTKTVTHETQKQSVLRRRLPKMEGQPQAVEMTRRSSSKMPYTVSNPLSLRSFLSSALTFFGFGGSSTGKYQRLPTDASDESQTIATLTKKE